MPKYCGKQNFSLGSSPKWVKSRRRKRNTLWTRGDRTLAAKRQKVGNNNGQLCIANATSGGARKSPGPKEEERDRAVPITCR